MLDSGPLIDLYDRQDSRGLAIQVAMERLQQQRYPIYITQLVIAEAHRRILYDVNYPQAVRFLRDITDGSVIIIGLEHGDIIQAINIIEKYSDQQITCADSATMAVMNRIGIRKVLSYDRHFQILGFVLLPEGQP